MEYYQIGCNKYKTWINSSGHYAFAIYGKIKSVHRHKYESYYLSGDTLSDDLVIHHKDENKLNNSINNLEALTRKEHAEEHRKNRSVFINGVEHRKCSFCGQLKTKDGYKRFSGYCRECENKKRMEKYYKNKTVENEKTKEYYKNNKDKCKDLMKEYREKNKEKISKKRREYYEKNKEKIKEYKRNWYLKNKKKARIL